MRIILLKTILALIVVAHMTVVIINLIALFLLPFLYTAFGVSFSTFLLVAVPLQSFVLRLTCDRTECPVTRLENSVRVKLGLKRIGGFIGYYIVRPIKRNFWQ